MLEPLYIKSFEVFPGIKLDPEQNVFEIYGRSLPEDVDSFYLPIVDWLLKYAENPNDITEFVFRFDYYNSSTIRKIVDILTILGQINERDDKSVVVKWYYEDGDDVMYENGEDLQNVVDVPIELVSFEF